MTTLERLKQKKIDDANSYSLNFCYLSDAIMQMDDGIKIKVPEATQAIEAVQKTLDSFDEGGEDFQELLAELLHATETQAFTNGLLRGLILAKDVTFEEFWNEYFLDPYEQG